MLDFSTPLAIIGAGSIGERYIRNLAYLGYTNIIVFRQRNLPFRDISNASVEIVTDWNKLLQKKPYAAFICTPTALHLQQSIDLLTNDIHVLVEKPLSHSLDGLGDLKNTIFNYKAYMHVGYMMRHHPALVKIQEIIRLNTFGNLLSLHSKWAEYLPDWHPWEDYRESYAAKEELGGGVALTLSHDIDMVNWLANSDVMKWHIIKNNASKLELSVESGADVIMKYKNGCTANVHLNFHEKKKERFLKLVFDEASIEFYFFDSKLIINSPTNKQIIEYTNFDRNQMFAKQIEYFLLKTKNFDKSDAIKQLDESEQIIKICNG